jgi:hypothetical protein
VPEKIYLKLLKRVFISETKIFIDSKPNGFFKFIAGAWEFGNKIKKILTQSIK